MNPAVTIVLFLQVGFINYCCSELAKDLIKIQEKYDPSTYLPKSDLELLNEAFKGIANEKLKDTLAKRMIEQRILILESIARQFTCAVGRVKNIIQHYYHEEKIETLPPHKSYTDFPEFHYDLISEQAKRDDYINVTDFKHNCAKWYTYIQNQACGKSARITRNLLAYYYKDPAKYKYDYNITLLHVNFCASISRCYHVFNFISRTLLPKMEAAKDYDKHNNEFFEFLFAEMKFYFLDEDDLHFIQILLRSRNDDNNLDEKHQLRFTTTPNPYLRSLLNPAKLQYTNDIRDKIEKGEVTIPLSKACLKQDVQSTKKLPLHSVNL